MGFEEKAPHRRDFCDTERMEAVINIWLLQGQATAVQTVTCSLLCPPPFSLHTHTHTHHLMCVTPSQQWDCGCWWEGERDAVVACNKISNTKESWHGSFFLQNLRVQFYMGMFELYLQIDTM